jgi:hypothetical protein
MVFSPCISIARSIKPTIPSLDRLMKSSSSSARPSRHAMTVPPLFVNLLSTASSGRSSSSRIRATRYPSSWNAKARLKALLIPPLSMSVTPSAPIPVRLFSIRRRSRPRASPTSLAPSQTMTEGARKRVRKQSHCTLDVLVCSNMSQFMYVTTSARDEELTP